MGVPSNAPPTARGGLNSPPAPRRGPFVDADERKEKITLYSTLSSAITEPTAIQCPPRSSGAGEWPIPAISSRGGGSVGVGHYRKFAISHLPLSAGVQGGCGYADTTQRATPTVLHPPTPPRPRRSVGCERTSPLHHTSHISLRSIQKSRGIHSTCQRRSACVQQQHRRLPQQPTTWCRRCSVGHPLQLREHLRRCAPHSGAVVPLNSPPRGPQPLSGPPTAPPARAPATVCPPQQRRRLPPQPATWCPPTLSGPPTAPARGRSPPASSPTAATARAASPPRPPAPPPHDPPPPSS